MSNWLGRCSVSKIKGGFQDRLAFFFFCLPLFSSTEGAYTNGAQLSGCQNIFCSVPRRQGTFFEKSLAGVLPPWLVQFCDFVVSVSSSFREPENASEI